MPELSDIERKAMIRCVKLIDAHAKEKYERELRIAIDGGFDADEIAEAAATAWRTTMAAMPICKELGMTIPECLKAEA